MLEPIPFAGMMEIDQMNNEPVAIPFAWYCAWLGENNEPVWEQYEECHPATKQWDNFPDKAIPLYTHPKGFNWSDVNNEQLINEVRSRGYIISNAQVSAHPAKELTDEEIMEVYMSIWNQPMEMEDIEKADINFARAILRKASEK